MRLGLGPTTGEVHERLSAIAATVLDVARTVEQRFSRWPAGPSQEEVKELEHAADERVSALLAMTQTMFVTPYDRDDIVALAYALDDVADAADNAAELPGLYGVELPTRQALALCALLVRACEHLSALVTNMRDAAVAEHEIATIKEIEDETDQVARAARVALFRDDRIDPLIVIRWKDIYEALEDAVDACDTAASRVGNILVKNA
jgi:predicted phosphate transport protein (TIGR00153 family)